MDAVKVKSRMFVIVFGTLATLLTLYNIYSSTFGPWNKGVILFKYIIEGEDYTIMKRSTQRSIYIQIMLFSMSGIYTMFKDKKMELLMFANGNIYRETGTASKEVKEKQYSMT